MRVQHWGGAVATTIILAACGASSGDDHAPAKPSDSDAGDASVAAITAETGAPIDGGTTAPPLKETCSDFTTGADGWAAIGDAVGSAPTGFNFALGATKRAISKSFKSDVDIRTTHVRIDWSFSGDTNSLAADATIQLLTQTYGEANLALRNDGGLGVAGNNGTNDAKGLLQSGATAAESLALVQGKSFKLATLWAASGSATVENAAAPLSVQLPTLSPENRGRDFTLEIGGTISGAVAITVTIRQVCVAFE